MTFFLSVIFNFFKWKFAEKNFQHDVKLKKFFFHLPLKKIRIEFFEMSVNDIKVKNRKEICFLARIVRTFSFHEVVILLLL